jgi:hypothetical protein
MRLRSAGRKIGAAMSELERDQEPRSWEALEDEAELAASELRRQMAGLRSRVWSLWTGGAPDEEGRPGEAGG